MQNDVQLSKKVHQLQIEAKASSLAIQQLKAHQVNIVNIQNQIKQILLSIKQLQSKVAINTLNINNIQKGMSDLKEGLRQLNAIIQKKVLESSNRATKQNIDLEQLEKEIHTIKVDLVQNDGQTNQCYMSIEKIYKLIEQLHPMKRQSSLSDTQNIETSDEKPAGIGQAQTEIKNMCHKIIVGILISIFVTIIGWLGTKYWQKFLDYEYNKMHNQPTETTQVQESSIKK